MKLLFITFLAFAFGYSARCYGQQVMQPSPVPYPVAVPVYAPPVVYVPQVIYQPYQYDRTEVIRREYRTPLRDWFLGRYRINHYYAPVPPQVAR